ncbi:homeobox protein Hox-D4-like [Cylas formicarius]|uniref:homeobox protein Hox-D4-like n=1 Tax=Cylas formicarius TaxID=197179 RepID=UPI00295867A7|nr:homeobox protein Hox-D4-like [Cylas formicarius]
MLIGGLPNLTVPQLSSTVPQMVPCYNQNHGQMPMQTTHGNHMWYAGGYYPHQGAQLQNHPYGNVEAPQSHIWYNHQLYHDFVHGIPALHQRQQQEQQQHMGIAKEEPNDEGGVKQFEQFEGFNQTDENGDQPSNTGKKKFTRTRDKYRMVYTEFQRMELEKEFSMNNRYITIGRKTELAAILGLTERQVKIWFQNRRAKDRKLAKKSNITDNSEGTFNFNMPLMDKTNNEYNSNTGPNLNREPIGNYSNKPFEPSIANGNGPGVSRCDNFLHFVPKIEPNENNYIDEKFTM